MSVIVIETEREEKRESNRKGSQFRKMLQNYKSGGLKCDPPVFLSFLLLTTEPDVLIIFLFTNQLVVKRFI